MQKKIFLFLFSCLVNDSPSVTGTVGTDLVHGVNTDSVTLTCGDTTTDVAAGWSGAITYEWYKANYGTSINAGRTVSGF